MCRRCGGPTLTECMSRLTNRKQQNQSEVLTRPLVPFVAAMASGVASFQTRLNALAIKKSAVISCARRAGRLV
jgi:hypothetical protein